MATILLSIVSKIEIVNRFLCVSSYFGTFVYFPYWILYNLKWVINVRIRELREAAGLTQEELGKVVQQSKSNISKYERKALEPSLETIKKLAEFFNVSVDYLLGLSNVKDIANPPKPIENGLTPENIEELKKYAELLKLKQMAEKNKEEASDEISSI